ncbi:unnamed protein product [Meloidogyne enterolobii]|uniref:Uncharacterized protein n=1 Tax=Meloidogyne enterolobii TaxID=390850 RepID=A0ACB1AFA7_MELEN
MFCFLIIFSKFNSLSNDTNLFQIRFVWIRIAPRAFEVGSRGSGFAWVETSEFVSGFFAKKSYGSEYGVGMGSFPNLDDFLFLF